MHELHWEASESACSDSCSLVMKLPHGVSQWRQYWRIRGNWKKIHLYSQ